MSLSRERIRILRIIARLNIGGPAIQAITLTKELSANGFDSQLVTGEVGFEEGNMAYLAKQADITPIFIPELGRAVSPRKDIAAFLKLRRIICRYRPHIVHTHTAKAGTLGRLAALSAGRNIATVHTFHGHVFHAYFSRWKSKIFIFIERLLARFTERIITISNSQCREICQTLNIVRLNQVKIVPLGFDLLPFKIAANKVDSKLREKLIAPSGSENAFLVGSIGRLTAIKNHSMLIKAMQLLNRKQCFNRLSVSIVGGGELEESLKNLAKRLNVAERIRFCGWHSDMPAVYSSLDAVVLTSLNEGTPVTLIEAMASGKPVVSTDVGGVIDLLGTTIRKMPGGFSVNLRGLSVPPNNPSALAEALLYLEKNPIEIGEMVKRAQQWVLERHGLDRLVDDHKKLYMELVEN